MSRKINVYRNLDWVTLFLYFVLMGIGLLSIYSADYSLNENDSSLFSRFHSQLVWLPLALVMGVIILSIKEKYLSDFNLEFTKDSIYYKRLKRCENRQQIVVDEVKKLEQRLIFGTVSMFLISKDEVYMSKYREEYVDEWKDGYKGFIIDLKLN